MAVVAHFGTFDVENYGDLLFPAILERRLGELGHGFVHVSPQGGPPVWGDCVPTVATDAFIGDSPELAGVIVGGGHVIHASPSSLDRYDQGGLSATLAYPSLWLGAAYLASQQNVPYCWNAPGVPQSFSPAGSRLVEWAASLADYLAVRDRASHSRLVDAGVSRAIRIVPDTALEISRLWPAEELETAFTDLFAERGREVPARVIVIHLNRRYAGEDVVLLASRLDRIAQRFDATPILIAMGPCHGDDQLQREVAQEMASDAVVIDRPRSLRQITACIARAEAYLGSSLHGMITACSFGTKGMVIVPRSAGTFGKFVGFLEPFQLTQWVAETWEDAEQRLDELIASPSNPWTRVLEAATPVLDEHWSRMGAILNPSTKARRRVLGLIDKTGAIDRLSPAKGSASPGETIYAPIIVEQAIRASQHLSAANEQRRQKEKALAEHQRLREAFDATRAAAAQTEQALDELRNDRDGLQEEWQRERERLQVEIQAREAEIAAEQTHTAQAHEERERLGAELTDEMARLQDEMVREREHRQAEADKQKTAQEIEEAAQFSRLQAAVENVLLREQGHVETARQTEERLARVDEHLAWLAARASTRKSSQRLRLARREVREALQNLRAGTDRSVFGQPGDRPGSATAEVFNRFLPGRPKSGALRQELATARTATDAGAISSVDIVVCVHNALDDVTRCLAALVRHTDSRYRVFVIDDGSDAACAAYLQEFTHRRPHFTLSRNDEPRGYTRAANLGLRTSTADMVVLLNSDSIVTDQWLERLIECAQSDPAIGIVGPLSNAASYQSVPERAAANGDWSLNPAPPGWDVEQLAAAVAEVSDRSFPRVPFVNGFCFAVKRAVIAAIGSFDEDAFPEGYGEENDYALRAADAGFTLAIADHAYVHHAKSRSYSHERRRELGKDGRGALLAKHGRERVRAAEGKLRDDPTLAALRQALTDRLKNEPPPASPLSVLFLLPVSGGGGGAHSIVQEAAGMRRLGIKAQVAVKARHLTHYRNNYPAVRDADDLFFGFDTEDDLQAYAARFSVVVATIHTSAPLLATIAAENPWVLPAYYVQDYEPFFYAEGSPERETAARSYTLIPDALLFAKTQWLCDTVNGLHGVEVHKVSPSLDHDVYYPSPEPHERERVRVAAMIRPRSRRRGAPRTMEVLKRLTEEFGKGVDVQMFGCMKSDIAASGLPNDFRYKNHGILKREEVAEVLRQTDIFMDLSDYQAFGRTGLEAMACGCAVIVPALGGTNEYAVHRENSLVVDSSNLEECYVAARELVEDQTLRERLQLVGVSKVSEYSIECAARSEIGLFVQTSREALFDLFQAHGASAASSYVH